MKDIDTFIFGLIFLIIGSFSIALFSIPAMVLGVVCLMFGSLGVLTAYGVIE